MQHVSTQQSAKWLRMFAKCGHLTIRPLSSQSSCYLTQGPVQEPVDGIADDVIEEDDDLDEGEENVDNQPTGAHSSFRHSYAGSQQPPLQES